MTVSPTRAQRSIVHFIKLARRGRFAGSSSGEKQAHRLAWAVINDLPGLDGSAIAGFEQFVCLANGNNGSAFHLLNDGGYPTESTFEEGPLTRSENPTRSPK